MQKEIHPGTFFLLILSFISFSGLLDSLEDLWILGIILFFLLLLYPPSGSFFKNVLKIGGLLLIGSFFIFYFLKDLNGFYRILLSTVAAIYYFSFFPPAEASQGIGWLLAKLSFGRIKEKDISYMVLGVESFFKKMKKRDLKSKEMADLLLEIYDKRLNLPNPSKHTKHPVLGFLICYLGGIATLCLT